MALHKRLTEQELDVVVDAMRNKLQNALRDGIEFSVETEFATEALWGGHARRQVPNGASHTLITIWGEKTNG